MDEILFSQVDNYLTDLFSIEDEVLIKTRESIVNNNMPEHSVSAAQGQLLYLLSRLCNAKNIIEIGTLGGYSTIWLARSLETNGKITSFEINSKYAEVARKNINLAGLSDRVEIKIGSAIKLLDKLDFSNPIDLFFMDADKPNYVNYFNWALAHSRIGSLIIADNVIRNGEILDNESKDDKIIGVKRYIEMLSKNNSVDTTILQSVGNKGYDGMAISVVK